MAQLQLFTNNAAAPLATTISDTDTAVQVSGGSGALFPNPSDPEFFIATLRNLTTEELEIVKVTGKMDDDTFIVVRGQEGTTPLAFTAGDATFGLRPTAQAFSNLYTYVDSAVPAVLTAAGTADALTLTPAVALTNYANGGRFLASLPNGANPDATINVSGLGALPLKYMTDQGTLRDIPGPGAASDPTAFIPEGFFADIIITASYALIFNAKMQHKIGEIFCWGGVGNPSTNPELLPPGTMLIPVDVGPNVQLPRADYPELFAIFGETYWDGGDPLEFGIVGIPSQYTVVQGTGTLWGSIVAGTVAQHNHTVPGSTSAGSTGTFQRINGGSITNSSTSSTGSGAGNLPAGLYTMFCLQVV